MKSIAFDSSSIISLSMNDLLWVLKPLEEKFKGDFLISDGVREELVDYPLKTRRFKFEALMIINLLNNNSLKIYSSDEVNKKAVFIEGLVNNLYKAKNEYIQIMQKGEIASLAVAIILGSMAYVVDERTTRLVVEDPERLEKILRNKLHTNVSINRNNLELLKKEVKKDLIDGLLWGLKLRGCSISEDEINEAISIY